MIADYFEALTAYRAFDVAENGLLVGQAFSEIWPPYEPMVAGCGGIATEERAAGHLVEGRLRTAPILNCTCGIYALKAMSQAEMRAKGVDGIQDWGWRRLGGRAWGTIKLWGRIIEHDEGYRAEFAYPSELFCADADLADRIAALYGVPCQHKPHQLEKDDVYDDGHIAGLYALQTLGRFNRASHSFLVPRPLGVITGITDDISQAPMIAQPTPAPLPGRVVGASRWQIRQYRRRGGKSNPSIVPPDWRTMMRKMVYKNG